MMGSYPEELTDDQVALLHEIAAARRRKWAEHNAMTTPRWAPAKGWTAKHTRAGTLAGRNGKRRWHVMDSNGMALCDYTISLLVDYAKNRPPEDFLVCGKCFYKMPYGDGEQKVE